MSRFLAYGAFLWAGHLTRTAADVLADVAVVLENFAGELAPYEYRAES